METLSREAVGLQAPALQPAPAVSVSAQKAHRSDIRLSPVAALARRPLPLRRALPLGSDMAVAAEAGEGQQVLAVAVEVGQHLHPNMLADTP